MDFEAWWAKQTANFDPEEIGLMQLARVTWNAAREIEREECAKLAMTEAAFQHVLDAVRNPRMAVMHSPDSAKWQKMAALIRMRSNA